MHDFGYPPYDYNLYDAPLENTAVTIDRAELEALIAQNAALEGKLRSTRAESARWFAHAIALQKDDYLLARRGRLIAARPSKEDAIEDKNARRKRKWDCRILPELHSREFLIGQKLVSCLNVQHVKIGLQLNVYASFMRFVPARLGESDALASATACLNSAYLDFVARKPELSIRSRRFYGAALANLRKTLMDQDKAGSSEGLCAAFFLTLYEVMNGSFAAHHLRGIAAMIKTYGLERYKDDLGLTLFTMLIPRLIVQSLHDRQPCFLADDEWISMLKKSNVESWSVCEHFDALILFAHVASFLCVTLASTKANNTKDYDSLLTKARDLRYKLKTLADAAMPLLKDEVLHAGEYTLTDACRAQVGIYAVMTLAVNLIIGKLHRMLDISLEPEVSKIIEEENRLLAALVQRTSAFAIKLGPLVNETVSLAIVLVTEIMDEMDLDLAKRDGHSLTPSEQPSLQALKSDSRASSSSESAADGPPTTDLNTGPKEVEPV